MERMQLSIDSRNQKVSATTEASAEYSRMISKAEDSIKAINFWISAEFPKSLKKMQEGKTLHLVDDSRIESFENIEKSLKN